MPYAPDHKQTTRTRILESARKLFNRHGFDTVSIEDIMADAGLTRGGFYYHFASKEELFAESLSHYAACNCPEVWIGDTAGIADPERTLAAMMVQAYLSEDHLAALDDHCPLIALPSDVARSGPGVRQVYHRLVSGMVETFRAGMADTTDPDEREKKALAMAALCVGGMVLARTVEDEGMRRKAREAACEAALSIGGLNPEFSVPTAAAAQ